MSKKVFTIQNTGQIVEIEYNWRWRNIVVRLGDSEIGHFETLAPLKEGQLLETKIGDIYIQHKQSLWSGRGFEVLYNYNLLGGSINDPIQHWQTGFKTALCLGLLNILAGMFTARLYIFHSTGPIVIFGIVVFILGLMSWWRRSAVELGIAALMFAADGVFSIVALSLAQLIANASTIIPFLIFRVIFVMLLARGAVGAGKIDKIEQLPEKAKNSY